MSFASIEEAWGVQSLSPRAKEPRAPRAPFVPVPQVSAAAVREHLARVYRSSGMAGVLKLLHPRARAALASRPCTTARVASRVASSTPVDGARAWWHDPEKLLLLVGAVFMVLVMADHFPSAPSAVAPPPW